MPLWRCVDQGSFGAPHTDAFQECGDGMDDPRIMEVLAGIAAPGGGDLVSAGLVEGVSVAGGVVQVALRARRETIGAMEAAGKLAEAGLRTLPGVRQVAIVLTSHKQAAATPPPARGHGPDIPAAEILKEVGAVIAVASGKGGVGKSTVAVNLAVALAGMGMRVGLIDADVHGPSLPRMLGVNRKPESRDGLMQPVEAFGLSCMSIGFLVPEDQAMIWRGPMVMGALTQMLGQVAWGTLDVMVIDLPPGTGDAQLTLSQKVTLKGAVIVSTPQDIALIDARRGVAMFEKVGVPILGLIENMSFFQCPHCGERTEIFGHGGARDEAVRMGVPFLGAVPLLLAVRQSGDAGRPIVLAAPDSEAGLAFKAIAARVAAFVA
jgi:ATP-binding protein involved in chromosome partitioning